MDDTPESYSVKMFERARRDLSDIYHYIANTLQEPGIAMNMVDKIENAILSLDIMPHRCPTRKAGAYANKGYRQLFVGNYIVIFRIDEAQKNVLVVTVRYSSIQF